MSGIDPAQKDKIIQFCSNPNLVNYTFLMLRPGVYGWMVELEYTKFTPDTEANNGFHMFVCKFPEIEPIDALTMCVVSIDKSGQEFADALLWNHGLKKVGPNKTFVCIGPHGQEEFFVHGPNTYVLENHSKGAKNVVYTNDPEKLRKAREHESQLAERFFLEHEAWLNTPEGKAIADAYWARHPSGKVY
jgi:hypothetical protein